MIRILIADGHAIVRVGLKQIVGTTADIVVSGEAAHGIEVLDRLRTCQVDLLLVEMMMRGIIADDLIRRVRAEQPALPILVLSVYNEAQVVSRALRAGATGYMTKHSEPEDLLVAIRKLACGGRFIDAKLVDAVVFEVRSEDAPPHGILSNREYQILQMLLAGRKLSDIAEALVLSAKTISSHKTRLMRKLSVDNTADLIRYGIRHGLNAA